MEKARKDMTLFTYSDFTPSTPYQVREDSFEIERNELLALRQRFEESMNGKYHDIQQLENQIAILQGTARTMKNQARIASLRKELGIITPLEHEQALTDLRMVENQLTSLENQLYRMVTVFRKPYLMPDYLS